jgi:hypothetical protein
LLAESEILRRGFLDLRKWPDVFILCVHAWLSALAGQELGRRYRSAQAVSL